MFSGKKLITFLTWTVFIDIACYYIAYSYPEIVVELATPFEKHFDSLFAVVIVGLTVGIVMKFQLGVFEKERSLTKEQQKELLLKSLKYSEEFIKLIQKRNFLKLQEFQDRVFVILLKKLKMSLNSLKKAPIWTPNVSSCRSFQNATPT